MNTSGTCNKIGKGVNLFTPDVISLYPSIKPELALTALQHALDSRAIDDSKKQTLHTFTDLIFKNSFVTFQGNVYKGKNGIPTGNCISRQAADIMLHW